MKHVTCTSTQVFLLNTGASPRVPVTHALKGVKCNCLFHNAENMGASDIHAVDTFSNMPSKSGVWASTTNSDRITQCFISLFQFRFLALISSGLLVGHVKIIAAIIGLP